MKGLEIHIEVRPEKRQEFLQAMGWLVERENRLTDVKSVSVFEKYGGPNQFLWVEHWQTDEELRTRLKSESFHALQGAIQVLGKLSSMRIVDVEDQDQTNGREE